MIVCSCHAVNDRRLRELVGAGATDVDTLKDVCGAGTDCGSCLPIIESIVASESVANAATSASMCSESRVSVGSRNVAA